MQKSSEENLRDQYVNDLMNLRIKSVCIGLEKLGSKFIHGVNEYAHILEEGAFFFMQQLIFNLKLCQWMVY